MLLVKSSAGGALTVDPAAWQTLAVGEALPSDGAVLVPLALWKEQRETLLQRNAPFGVWLDSGETLDQWGDSLADDLQRLTLVALNFPAFSDGRPYSTAALLRQRYGFAGELRAVGDVLLDQLSPLARVGFTAFAVKNSDDLSAVTDALQRFHHVYQAAADGRSPLWQRRQAAATVAE